MSVSLKELDSAFQGAGQKAGLEIWRIENFCPVRVPDSSHGKFYTGDSYIVLKTTATKTGALRHDIHYWLGKDTSQDEAGTAAVKTVELDAALGGRAVQYREAQGHETEKFLSYLKPCIIPLEGGVLSGFKHPEAEEFKPRLYICNGKHVVHVNEVPCARSSLNHDDIFILDTQSKIFQFNGSNSSIQERAKALEVVQYVKDNYHHGKCDIAAIEDGKLMADAESGEFWGFFGGFAPLPRKTTVEGEKKVEPIPPKLFCFEKENLEPVEVGTLTRELLNTGKCYVLDCGAEVFVWMGRNTSLDTRKNASRVTEELVQSPDRPKSHITRIIEGFETVIFRAKFDSWPQNTEVAVSEEGRGKVAALLRRQGVNVKGLMKAAPAKDELQPYIDCTGNLQVWRVNGNEKTLLSASEQAKFYSGDCYIFQYSYPGEEKEEYLIGTWFGKQSIEEERTSAAILASKMVHSLKFVPTQARVYEGNEPIQFFAIFQSFIVFKGGLSEGYKKYIAQNKIPDDTYTDDGVALFRVLGSGPNNMQAIQVDPAASSLNSSYCYILHSGSTVFKWNGSLVSSEDQELVERQLDVIKPNSQSKMQKEGAESQQFWELLGGKSEYPSQKITLEFESDPHLFSGNFSKGVLKVTEIYNFSQDDLMTEDVFILDRHSDIFVWVGQQVDSKTRAQALTIGEKFVERDFLLEKLSPRVPIYVVMEAHEPPFFTRFFTWDSAKYAIHGNSFQRKLVLLKGGGTPAIEKPKRRTPTSYAGRSSVLDKSSNRSRSMSFSPDRVRGRGRSPALNALASAFENPNARNLSTPPPTVRKPYPKSGTPDSAPKAAAIAAFITTSSEQTPREPIVPRYHEVTPEATKETPPPEPNSKENSEETSMGSIEEDAKEGETEVEDEAGLSLYPYERLKTTSTDPVAGIDITKRETYLSAAEFKEKFGMTKDAFCKLPKWKQNKLKMALQLF